MHADTHTDTITETSWARLRRVQLRIGERVAGALAEEAGLSQADLDVLTLLSTYPDESVRDMVLRCGLEWEKSRLSHQLRRMQSRGLIERVACAEDARGSMARLTERGRDAAAHGARIEAAVIAEHVDAALQPHQAEVLEDIAVAILATFEEKHRT